MTIVFLQGIWSIELARGCPKTTTFTLLEYNPDVCHAVYPSLPENVSIQQFDLLEDFEHHPEWKNRFDIVHERLLFSGWTPKNWRSVFQSYFEVLKPGGYLQLWEMDTRSKETWDFGPWYHTSCSWGFELGRERGVKHEIIEDLADFLKEAGFIVAAKDPFHIDFTHQPTEPEPVPDTANWWYTNTSRALATRAYELGRVSEQEWEQYQAGIKDEFRLADKSKLFFQSWVIIAQVCPIHCTPVQF
jgi:SAM-dependent methyltransferase